MKIELTEDEVTQILCEWAQKCTPTREKFKSMTVYGSLNGEPYKFEIDTDAGRSQA